MGFKPQNWVTLEDAFHNPEKYIEIAKNSEEHIQLLKQIELLKEAEIIKRELENELKNKKPTN